MSEKTINVLKRHLAEAEAAKRFHRQRKATGNVEALIAALKVNWLQALIREIGDPAHV